MAVLWSDDFNRSDGAFSDADVTNTGNLRIVSNTLSTTTNYSNVGPLIDGPTYTDYQWIKATWDLQGTGTIGGYASFIQLNATTLNFSAGSRATSDGYSLRIDSGSPGEVYKGATYLGALTGFSPTAGDEIEFRRVDNGGGSTDLEAYINGSFVDSITDGSANLTGGYPGFCSFGAEPSASPGITTWDNVEAGDDSPSTPPNIPQNLVATTVDDDSIDLDWDAVTGADAYVVERDDSPWVVLDDYVLTNSYTDSGLDPSTEYTYRVRSVF